jgi:hypothetical protein
MWGVVAQSLMVVLRAPDRVTLVRYLVQCLGLREYCIKGSDDFKKKSEENGTCLAL